MTFGLNSNVLRYTVYYFWKKVLCASRHSCEFVVAIKQSWSEVHDGAREWGGGRVGGVEHQ